MLTPPRLALAHTHTGNEADIDTTTDATSVLRQELVTPSPEVLYRDFARSMAERLVQSALMARSRDNVSVMVVLLPGASDVAVLE